MVAPEFPLATPWSESTIPLAHAVNEMPIDPAAYRQARLAAMKMFAEEKVSAVLIASEKEFGLLNMSSQSREYQAGLVPVAYSVREDYEMLWNLQEAGHAEAEVSIAGSLSGKPVQVYNTVAEIRGGGKPGEVVIIGAGPELRGVGTRRPDQRAGAVEGRWGGGGARAKRGGGGE